MGGWLGVCLVVVCRGGFGTTVGELWVYGFVKMSHTPVIWRFRAFIDWNAKYLSPTS